MSEQALLPVGRDCECGHPLVWRDGQQWCAVYGAHKAVSPAELARVERATLARLRANVAAESGPPEPSGRRAVPKVKRLRVVA